MPTFRRTEMRVATLEMTISEDELPDNWDELDVFDQEQFLHSYETLHGADVVADDYYDEDDPWEEIS